MASGHSFQTGSRRRQFRVMSVEQIMVFLHFWKASIFGNVFPKIVTFFFPKMESFFQKWEGKTTLATLIKFWH